MRIVVGDKAPDFVLRNTAKEEVSLSSLKGENLVLLFFPLAFTSVCTEELCHVRDNLQDFNNVNAKVFGISVDSLFTLGKFKEEQKLNFPLLSDFNKTVAKAYGSWYDQFALGMQGVAKRSAFVIDAKGTIQYAEVLDNAGEIPNFKAILDTLNSL